MTHLSEWHQRNRDEENKRYQAGHWMPMDRLKYVIGVSQPVEDIDAEKTKKIDADRFYNFHNGKKA